ncbi:MAG: hypothetical protein AAF485_27515 [Chloroflexota bacterium]
MEITTVTVKIGMTWNLGDYSNVRPEVEMTATLDESEIPAEVAEALVMECKTLVHQQIDEALEDQGSPAEFSTDPRYKMIQGVDEKKLIAIIPDEVEAPDGWFLRKSGHRITPTVRYVEKYENQEGYRIITCVDGDLSRLPEMVKVRYAKFRNHNSGQWYLVLVPADHGKDDFPERWQDIFWTASYNHHPADRIMPHFEAICAGDDAILVDCRDSDFSKLPELPQLPDPLAPEEDDESDGYHDEDYEYYDDEDEYDE